ncbi:hypothetical protein NSQ26_12835 [Bacillus sp. FSL W7-1360]
MTVKNEKNNRCILIGIVTLFITAIGGAILWGVKSGNVSGTFAMLLPYVFIAVLAFLAIYFRSIIFFLGAVTFALQHIGGSLNKPLVTIDDNPLLFVLTILSSVIIGIGIFKVIRLLSSRRKV